jgi:hypothetical protein
MALTGHLSDLSLSELIEFFCNQRKSANLRFFIHRVPASFIYRLAPLLTRALVSCAV